MKFSIIIAVFLISFTQINTIKHSQKFKLKIDEPSDISLSTDGSSFFVVSDKGALYKTDLNGKITLKAKLQGTDFEGVYVKNNKIYVVDERYRKIYILDEDSLTQEKVITIPYSGGRNSAYEGFCWNETRKRFVLPIEKSPVMLYELDQNLSLINEIDFKYSSDISSVTYANGFIWILSEEDHCLMKANPSNYKVIKKYNINVVGAEGVVFDREKNMYITSDGMAMLYKFNPIND